MSRLCVCSVCLLLTLCLLSGCAKQAPPAPAEKDQTATKAADVPAEKADTASPAKEPAKHSEIVDIVGQDAFLKFIEETPIAVIDFSAQWCGPCKMFVPDLEKVATEYKDKGVKVGRVDVDANRNIAASYNVSGIPDIRIFVKGKTADKVVGYNPDGLQKAVKKAIANFDKPLEDYTTTPLEDELWPNDKKK